MPFSPLRLRAVRLAAFAVGATAAMPAGAAGKLAALIGYIEKAALDGSVRPVLLVP